jgi:hypothetical protein
MGTVCTKSDRTTGNYQNIKNSVVMYKDKNKKGKTKNVEEINEKWDGKLDLSALKF